MGYERHVWARLPPFGGARFLDFINAVDSEDKSRPPGDGLPDWETALAWAERLGALTAAERERLARAHADDGAAEHRVLLTLREDGYRVLSAIASGAAPPEDGLATLVEAARAATQGADLTAAPKGGLGFLAGADALGPRLLRVRLGLDLMDLIAAAEWRRLRECGRCTGLFLDHGRGRGRRWCRMNTCGNREKVRRHRQGARSPTTIKRS